VNAADILRSFIRANAKSDGAMDALDALHELEAAALDATGERDRRAAYSRAIVQAQIDIQPSYKNRFVDLSGKGSYKVTETEQILELCKDVMAPHRLAIEVGDSSVVFVESAPFVRVGLGIRHELGHVRMTSQDFPLDGRGDRDKVWRGAKTSALGYFLRDAFALPRLKDEGEAAAAVQARSGPRRAETVRQAPRQPAPADAPALNLSPKEQATRTRILAADADTLGKAEGHLADARAALDSADDENPAPYSEPVLRALEAAARERRAALEATRGA
jgi:hypothetical protein